MKKARIPLIPLAAAAFLSVASLCRAVDPSAPGLGLPPGDGLQLNGPLSIPIDQTLGAVDQCVYVYTDPCGRHAQDFSNPPLPPNIQIVQNTALGTQYCFTGGSCYPKDSCSQMAACSAALAKALKEASQTAQDASAKAAADQAAKDAAAKQQKELVAGYKTQNWTAGTDNSNNPNPADNSGGSGMGALNFPGGRSGPGTRTNTPESSPAGSPDTHALADDAVDHTLASSDDNGNGPFAGLGGQGASRPNGNDPSGVNPPPATGRGTTVASRDEASPQSAAIDTSGWKSFRSLKAAIEKVVNPDISNTVPQINQSPTDDLKNPRPESTVTPNPNQ